ncbi:MAG: penicillin-binding transpeptidase domain-containing protein [Cyclonatronaceae bacterium]
MMIVFFAVLLMPAAIFFQLLRLQFAEGEALRELWSDQATDFVSIPAQRGSVYDSQGRILATNTISYSIAVDPLAPGVQENEELPEIAKILAHFTEQPASYYQQIIDTAPERSRYIVLGRQFKRPVYDSLQTRRFRSLILEEDYRRRYNYDELGAQMLGYVNHYMRGAMGLEAYYNEELSGTDGIQEVRKDSRNRIREYVGAPRRMPVQGNSLITTIDAQIQAIAEEELRQGIERTGAKEGNVIIVEPATGRIKAMAGYPAYNPNTPGLFPSEYRRNSAIADIVEPGSTFKLVTAVAALEQGHVRLSEIFETPLSGEERVHGQWMRDHDPLGTLSFQQAIEKSSNVAISRVAQRIPQDVFYQYVRNLGFGTTSGIDLPGEESGRLQPPFNWSRVTQPWMSVGYEIQATPLQTVMAYAALANNGRLMRPYVVERIINENEETLFERKPVALRQAIRPETVAELRPVFENVVSEKGTAALAALDQVSIAGKTGTAQKFVEGRYQSRYRASFVGFYPSENPQYVALVMLDEPQTSIYGGVTAGPVFRNIARRIAALDEGLIAAQPRARFPEAGQARSVPNLRGLSYAEATRLLEYQGLDYEVVGDDGTAVSANLPPDSNRYVESQQPEAGAAAEGRYVRLRMGSEGPASASAEASSGQRVPDVTGLSMRQAVRRLREAGYIVNRNGSGTISAQFPQAGAAMPAGRTVLIRGRAPDMDELARVVQIEE